MKFVNAAMILISFTMRFLDIFAFLIFHLNFVHFFEFQGTMWAHLNCPIYLFGFVLSKVLEKGS